MFVLLNSLCLLFISSLSDAEYAPGSLQSGRKSKLHQFKMVINNVHSTFHIGKVYGENTATNNRSWNDFFLHFIDLNENNICPCQQVFGKVFILALPCQISISLWGFGDAFSDRIFFFTVLLHLDFYHGESLLDLTKQFCDCQLNSTSG